jgi:hypothetical protein
MKEFAVAALRRQGRATIVTLTRRNEVRDHHAQVIGPETFPDAGSPT